MLIRLKADFDAVVLCGGATVKRNIPIPGSELKGVHQAMEFLKLNNQHVDGLVDFKDILSAERQKCHCNRWRRYRFRLYWNVQPSWCNICYEFRNIIETLRRTSCKSTVALLANEAKDNLFTSRRSRTIF